MYLKPEAEGTMLSVEDADGVLGGGAREVVIVVVVVVVVVVVPFVAALESVGVGVVEPNTLTAAVLDCA